MKITKFDENYAWKLGNTTTLGTSTSGDASGTLPGPITVTGINGVAVSGTPSAGQEIVAINATSASWQTVGSGTITTKDEGSTLSSTVTTLDFVGAGVTASGSGAMTTVTIPGGGSGGTPAVVLGTAAAAGSAATFLRDDDTIVAFDTTVPVTQAFGDAAATGSVAKAARRDHVHGMPATPPTGVGPILISDTPSTPLVFADLIQNDPGTDLLYADL
jgi:hypothetical protein